MTTMTSLIRDVLFPAAAALGLLAAAAVDTARAGEAAAPKPAVIAAASVIAAQPAAVADPSSDRASTAGADERPRKGGIERRCERTDRIGKFRITRCD
jgi:hypothetical protein